MILIGILALAAILIVATISTDLEETFSDKNWMNNDKDNDR